MKGIIVDALFQLTPLSSAEDLKLQFLNARKETQPYKDKSCGCISAIQQTVLLGS